MPGKKPEREEAPKTHAVCANCGSTVCQQACFEDDNDIETVSEAGDYGMNLEQSVMEELTAMSFERPPEFTVADQLEQDSPSFKPQALIEFEEREFKRKNRNKS